MSKLWKPLEVNDVILTIDPGVTTGLCAGTYLAPRQFSLEVATEVYWDQRFLIKEFLETYQPAHIVIEDFRLRKHAAMEQVGSQFPSSRFIGIVEAYANLLGMLNRIVEQQPSVRYIGKGQLISINPAHARLLTGSDHKRDAYLHLRYFVLVNSGKTV